MNTIKHIRRNVLRVNQTDLAKAAKTTQVQVSRWERDEASPSLEELKNICDAYPSVTPSAFFEMPPPDEPHGQGAAQ